MNDESSEQGFSTMTSITVLVSAYNEEGQLEKSVKRYDSLICKYFKDYEIIILEDGSTDKTAQIADELVKSNPRWSVIHNKVNMNVGYGYKRGVAAATKKYITILPGSGGIDSDSIETFLKEVGSEEIVIAYTANMQERPWNRQIISRVFTTTMNLLFGLHLKYYLGMIAYETDLVRMTKQSTNSYAFSAEILVQLLKRGHKYKEIPMKIEAQGGGKMFKLSNFVGIIISIVRLFFNVRIKRIFR